MRWTIVALIRLLLFAALVAGWAYFFIFAAPITTSSPTTLNVILYVLAASGAFGYANVVDRAIDNKFSRKEKELAQ